jgi:3',5'-cyclic AMP phosphodiesterase CpdA
MRIIQITDLHFGAHNANLMNSLRDRVRVLLPDLVVASGDLVDSPRSDLFESAFSFLKELETSTKPKPDSDAARPRLIVVPGNHDFLEKGIVKFFSHDLYERYRAEHSTDYFFQPENVWVFAFDSAKEGSFAGGKVRDSELNRFHAEYVKNLTTHGSAFEKAFKIVVVHHHLLPVNWDTDWMQRWLTMFNAGTLIGAILHRQIDLVLHGHEHLQARSRLKSTLGGENGSEIVVVSLGATLRKVNSPDRNWFNVIDILEGGEADLFSCPADQFSFEDLDKSEKYVVRSVESARERSFGQEVKSFGYHYAGVTSITELDMDGDCRRIVECDDLQISNPVAERTQGHRLQFPHTSGHIKLVTAWVQPWSPHQGIHVQEIKNGNHTAQTKEVVIKYGQNVILQKGEKITYRYGWYAINSFAMDGRQFINKYADPSGLEFTHMPVEDPIEQLNVIVRFPKDFIPFAKPQIRVTKPDLLVADNRLWKRIGEIERDLEESQALRYVESLRIASLRVTRPKIGYCYGIEWKVPDLLVPWHPSARIQQAKNTALHLSQSKSTSEIILPIVILAGKTARKLLLPGWAGDLEFTLMLFNDETRKLSSVAAVRLGNREDQYAKLDAKTELSYGVGIAGRALKVNEQRLYVYRSTKTQKTPDYFHQVAGQRPPACLLAVPVRDPEESNDAYGVFNITATDFKCPLCRGGELDELVPDSARANFQSFIDTAIMQGLEALDRTVAEKGEGPA